MDNLIELFDDDVNLEMNALNFVYGSGRELILPQVDTLNMLQILFVGEGDFTIQGNGAQIGVGAVYGDYATTSPGKPGHDTQPKFVYIPSLNRWIIISISIAYVVDDAEKPIGVKDE